MPALTEAEVIAVTDAHRLALAEGDRSLSEFERKWLVAVVAESAQRTRTWLATRVEGGDELVGPLDAFAGVLTPTDVVGRTLASAEKTAFDQARAAVTAVLVKGTAPVWIGSLVAFVVGLAGYVYDAGVTVGAGIAALLATGTGVAVVSRGLAASGPALSSAGQAVNQAAVRSLDAAGNIGAAAEQLYGRTAGVAVADLYRTGGGSAPRLTSLDRIRSYARTGVVAAWTALAVAAVICVLGVAAGFQAASTTNSGITTTTLF